MSESVDTARSAVRDERDVGASGEATPSNVVVVHNHYRLSGGEDQVVRAEVAMLRARGHHVTLFERDNDQIEGMSSVRLAQSLIWNRGVYDELRALIRQHAPAVVHAHNTFPLVSPAAYYAARREGAAVIQTLHNFRLVCPGGLLFRDGRPCEDCIGKPIAWPGIVHACYHHNRRDTAASVAMVSIQRARRTWADVIDAYIALSEFSRDRFIRGGLPAERTFVKPNFLPDDPGLGAHEGDFALFVGRLSPEKGVQVLLDAWATLGGTRTLKIVGSGPAKPESSPPGVEWLGQQPTTRVLELMQQARFLVLPSECYENFPVTIAEAYATGLPVIASRIGSLVELVLDGETGLRFDLGSANDLAAKIRWAFEHPREIASMGARARRTFVERFDADRNYATLMTIYDSAARRVQLRRA